MIIIISIGNGEVAEHQIIDRIIDTFVNTKYLSHTLEKLNTVLVDKANFVDTATVSVGRPMQSRGGELFVINYCFFVLALAQQGISAVTNATAPLDIAINEV